MSVASCGQTDAANATGTRHSRGRTGSPARPSAWRVCNVDVPSPRSYTIGEGNQASFIQCQFLKTQNTIKVEAGRRAPTPQSTTWWLYTNTAPVHTCMISPGSNGNNQSSSRSRSDSAFEGSKGNRVAMYLASDVTRS